MVTVPIYFAGETPQGYRLFREFRQVEADNPMEEAVALMVAGDALDPDYVSLWTSVGSFDSVSFSAGAGRSSRRSRTTTGPRRPGDMTEEQAKLALQQFVYTRPGHPAGAGAGARRRTAPTRRPSSASTPRAASRPPKPLDVLAFMNVTTPEEGKRSAAPSPPAVSAARSRPPSSGRSATRAAPPCSTGFATAEGWIDKLYPWETEVDVSSLDPGTYTFVALTDDPSGGEGGGPTEDTKTIIVS